MSDTDFSGFTDITNRAYKRWKPRRTRPSHRVTLVLVALSLTGLLLIAFA